VPPQPDFGIKSGRCLHLSDNWEFGGNDNTGAGEACAGQCSAKIEHFRENDPASQQNRWRDIDARAAFWPRRERSPRRDREMVLANPVLWVTITAIAKPVLRNC